MKTEAVAEPHPVSAIQEGKLLQYLASRLADTDKVIRFAERVAVDTPEEAWQRIRLRHEVLPTSGLFRLAQSAGRGSEVGS